MHPDWSHIFVCNPEGCHALTPTKCTMVYASKRSKQIEPHRYHSSWMLKCWLCSLIRGNNLTSMARNPGGWSIWQRRRAAPAYSFKCFQCFKCFEDKHLKSLATSIISISNKPEMSGDGLQQQTLPGLKTDWPWPWCKNLSGSRTCIHSWWPREHNTISQNIKCNNYIIYIYIYNYKKYIY